MKLELDLKLELKLRLDEDLSLVDKLTAFVRNVPTLEILGVGKFPTFKFPTLSR